MSGNASVSVASVQNKNGGGSVNFAPTVSGNTHLKLTYADVEKIEQAEHAFI